MKATFLLMLFAVCLVSKIGLADCSISTNCGTCNSGNQDTPGMIITRGAPIEIETAVDTKLQISKFKLDITPNQINGASFMIKNLATSDLIAYSVVVNTYWDSAPTIPMPIRVFSDGWFMKQYVLHPGDSSPGAITGGITPNTPMRLLKITVVPDYAEFADGTVAGESASLLKDKLAASRRSKEHVRQAYVSMLKSGKDVASIIAILNSEKPQVIVDDASSRLALSMLRTVATRQGEAAFLKVLEEEPPPLGRTPVNK